MTLFIGIIFLAKIDSRKPNRWFIKVDKLKVFSKIFVNTN